MESSPSSQSHNGDVKASNGRVVKPELRTGSNSTSSPVFSSHEASILSPSTDSQSSITSPPYWLQSHRRSFSNISAETLLPGAITLQDNTDGESDRKNAHCWARGVHIDDHVVVNGSLSGLGAFVVWNVTIETLNGGSIRIRKRYSEFDDLRERLLMTFPLSEGAMPPLPPKSVISKFRPKFLEHRRIGLSYFLNCILLNPEFSGSPVLKEFLFES